MGRLLLLSIFLTVSTGYSQDCPIAEPVQSFCQSEGTGNDFYQPAVKHLSATVTSGEILWFDSLSSVDALDPETILVTGDYYAGNSTGTCAERTLVQVNIDDAPNAGRTTHVAFCSTDAPVDLLDLYNPSILGPPDRGGYFTPPLSSGTTIFDPAVDRAGDYLYTVTSPNAACPNDESVITVAIVRTPNAGQNASLEVGSEDGMVDLFDLLNGSPEAGGTWSPALSGEDGMFNPSLDPSGVYTYEVSVTQKVVNVGNITCTSSATVQITVHPDSRTICHRGTSTIVQENSVKGHLKHGDTQGRCEALPMTEVSVAPNPSNGNYELTSLHSEITEVYVRNMHGEVLQSFQGEGMNQRIDITSFKPGIYFAEVHTAGGKTVQRLVKN